MVSRDASIPGARAEETISRAAVAGQPRDLAPVEQLAPLLLAVALALGVAGSVLLRPLPWGVGAALWSGLAAAAAVLVAHRTGTGLGRGRGWLAAVPPVLLAGGLAWCDAEVLKLLDAAAATVAFAWLIAPVALDRAGTFRRHYDRPGPADAVAGVVVGATRCLVGAPPLVSAAAGAMRCRAGATPGSGWGWGPMPVAIGRGVALALVPLLAFGALLGAADAVFAGWLGLALPTRWGWDGGAALGHLLVAAVVGWLAAGALRAVAGEAAVAPIAAPAPETIRLGAVEIRIVLGAIDALFALFVLAQLRSRFGGAAWVEAATGLTYADYARRGFFELVAVAALALPLLLLVDWLRWRPTGGRTDRASRLFRALGAGQVVLLAVMLASAVQRMRLYQREYGLTELRLSTSAFMAWLGLILVCFAMTVLRDRRRHFFGGTVAAGVAIVIGLHVVNPDALIVRANAALAVAAGGHPFDATYALGLSADAVPALLAAYPALPAVDRCVVGDRLLERWGEGGAAWQTWSWGRSAATSAVARRRSALACDVDDSLSRDPSAS